MIQTVLSAHKVKINLTQAYYKCGSTHSSDTWKAQQLQKQAQDWQVTFTSNLLFQLPVGAVSFSQQGFIAAPCKQPALSISSWVLILGCGWCHWPSQAAPTPPLCAWAHTPAVLAWRWWDEGGYTCTGWKNAAAELKDVAITESQNV